MNLMTVFTFANFCVILILENLSNWVMQYTGVWKLFLLENLLNSVVQCTGGLKAIFII